MVVCGWQVVGVVVPSHIHTMVQIGMVLETQSISVIQQILCGQEPHGSHSVLLIPTVGSLLMDLIGTVMVKVILPHCMEVP